MSSIHAVTSKDQARHQSMPSSVKRRTRTNRTYTCVVEFATHPSAPTLQQLQEVAAGCFADLIVAWVTEHGQGVQR